MSTNEQVAAQPTDDKLLGRSAVTSIAEMADVLADVKRAAGPPGPAARSGVLDVGCGIGVDAAEMAGQVGRNGRGAGVDTVPSVVEEARARTVGVRDQVDLRVADGRDLPFRDAAFDACRAERVLQHVPEPEKVISEMLRVTKPGGIIVVADPDHEMWALDMDDRHVTDALVTWWFDHVANPWMGRRLPGLLRSAGVVNVRVAVMPVVLPDLVSADKLTGITMMASSAAAQGVITHAEADAWEEELRTRDGEGRILIYGAIVAVHGTKRVR
jgi:SAM-dependent methyltransferase